MGKRNDTEISFEGKDFFIGFDVDKKKWTVTVRSHDMELNRVVMDPRPDVLNRYMRKRYPEGVYHSVYEAGFCGLWIHRRLAELGFDSMVVNSADVPTSHKEKDRKNDKVDSRKLARELEKADLEPIYVPSEPDQNMRILARHLDTCTREQTRVKNRIKSLLDFVGIFIPEDFSNWSGRFIQWLESLPFDNGPCKQTMHFLLQELHQHRRRILEVRRAIRRYCKQKGGWDVIRLLETIPGIAFRTAVTLYTELIDMKRFKTFDKIKAFVGLIPSTKDTGEIHHDRGITKRRNPYLRYVLIEASWVAMRKDPALLEYYSRFPGRMKKQEAIIRVAKKLLRRIRYVWNHMTPYEISTK